MIHKQLTTLINEALATLSVEGIEPALTHPDDPVHGDYATNVALIVGNKLEQNPHDVAKTLVEHIRTHKPDVVEKVEIAGPGFINFHLVPTFFAEQVHSVLDAGDEYGKSGTLDGKKIMVEYTDPNILKVFHVGHLMSNAVGESIARLLKKQGAHVVHANYQGDVGMHIAKAVWGMQRLSSDRPADDASIQDKMEFIQKAYVLGAEAYEKEAAEDIRRINKLVYEKTDEDINELYQWGRQASLDHFEEIYAMLGTRFDHYFFESDVAYDGQEVVEQYLEKGVFEKSDGAVIFPGEKYGLHNRVFINSEGLPTYEAKEIGVNTRKFNIESNLDTSIVITGNEIDEYFKVVMKALEHIAPEVAEKTRHISHGMMRGVEGKYSSRKGNAPSGEMLLDALKERVEKIIAERDLPEGEKGSIGQMVAVGAIKYAILKQSIGKDITFDMEQSVSFEGDSGPYLQYTHTRAHAVCEKARSEGITPSVEILEGWETTNLERMLYQFPEVVARSAEQYAPHLVTTYLTNLSATFNSFYAQVRIADAEDATAPYKVALAHATRQVMRNGLNVLGIEAPERM